ncbi:MAG: YCF48-related protein [Flavobacteriaceae bacterium]
MKSILIKSLFVFLVSIQTYGQYDWETVVSFTPSQSIKDIYQVDESIAYALSSLYNGSGLTVKKSTNAGVTWTELNTGVTAGIGYQKIGSPNNGGDIFIVGSLGTLLHSADGGTTWNSITTSIGTTNLRDIYFLSNMIGYIAADSANILKTTDGGLTWVDINPTMTGVSTIGRIYFKTELNGYIGGFNFFKETFDGGFTWTDVPGHEPQTNANIFQIQKIEFLDSNVGYFSGDRGLLYKTIDGGTTWVDKQVTIPGFVVESLFDFEFMEGNPDIGFACGYHGLLIATDDGGDSWEFHTSDLPNTNGTNGSLFYTMSFYGDTGLMGAQGGKILKFKSSIPTAINDHSLDDDVTIYPNPTNDYINILGEISKIDAIKIIDIHGKVIKMITQNVTSVNCQDLNPGTYFIKITSDLKSYNKIFLKK